MPKRRNFTQELLAKKAEGCIIVISLESHAGLPVDYSPRSAHDPEPWTAGLVYRFSGRECHAIRKETVTQFEQDDILRLIGTLYDGAFQMGSDDMTYDYPLPKLVSILLALVAEGMIDRRGNAFVLTRKGYNHLVDDLGVNARKLAYI